MGLDKCYQGCECFGANPEFDGVLAYLRSCATPRPTYRLPWAAEFVVKREHHISALSEL